MRNAKFVWPHAKNVQPMLREPNAFPVCQESTEKLIQPTSSVFVRKAITKPNNYANVQIILYYFIISLFLIVQSLYELFWMPYMCNRKQLSAWYFIKNVCL